MLAFAGALVQDNAPTHAAGGGLNLPDWSGIFNADGSVNDAGAAGGLHAIFVGEVQSDGEAIDLSTFNGATTAISDGIVDNDIVALGQDVGNVLVYSAENKFGDLEIFVGVERTIGDNTGSVSVELNQVRIATGIGVPWYMDGVRTDGDIVVQAQFSAAGELTSAEVLSWNEATSTFGQIARGKARRSCAKDGSALLACDGPAEIDISNDLGRSDADGQPLPAVDPDAFLQLGVNVEALLGVRPVYQGIQVRTDGDIVLSNLWID